MLQPLTDGRNAYEVSIYTRHVRAAVRDNQSHILFYVVAIVFGIAFSGVMASFLVCIRMMVPAGVLARSMAVVGMFGWFGMGLGGWLGGLIFDLTGSYHWSFATGSISGIVNLIILFFFYIYIRRHRLNGNGYSANRYSK